MTNASAEEIYHATIMDRARRPRHQQLLADAPVSVEERNPLCGDRVRLQMRQDADGRIAALGYQARACAICMAAADLMAEIVPGMTEAEARRVAESFEASLRHGECIGADSQLSPLVIFQPLRAVPSRILCAVLPFKALEKALNGG
jgi:nitrogen fixation NifU-like protein